MEKLYELFAKSLAGAALIIAALCICSIIAAFPVKWTWNASMPGIFGLKEIGYWEAFCLIWLAGSFFKASPVKS